MRNRHDRFAEAHVAADTRYNQAFGTQWRDLLVDVAEAARQDGYRTYRVKPGGHELPVVNDCLIYVWRLPESCAGVEAFASSPTRVNSFTAPPPHPMLFDIVPGGSESERAAGNRDISILTDLARQAAEESMPLVLVVVHSTPRQLQQIEWGVAELDERSGSVVLHGKDILWTAEPQIQADVTNVESFDSGVPTPPQIEPREQEGTDTDAR